MSGMIFISPVIIHIYTITDHIISSGWGDFLKHPKSPEPATTFCAFLHYFLPWLYFSFLRFYPFTEGGVKISPRPPAEALVFVPVVRTNKRTLIVIVSWLEKYSCWFLVPVSCTNSRRKGGSYMELKWLYSFKSLVSILSRNIFCILVPGRQARYLSPAFWVQNVEQEV